MKKFAVLIVISVFLLGCEKEDRYIHLKESYRSILKAGDTLLYKSNLNNEAVYVVHLKVKGYFFSDRVPYPWSYTVEGPGMAKNFALGSTFSGTDEFSVSWYNFQQKDFKTRYTMKILDKEFKNVLICELEPPAGSTGRYVSTVYCNSRECLLGFKYSDGEIFELN